MNLMVLIIFLIYKVKFQFTVQSIIGATDTLKGFASHAFSILSVIQ